MASISKIKIGNTTYLIEAASVSGVSYTATLKSGTAIGTLTINGTSYTLYCSTVPTNVSDFVNDAGYIDSSALSDYYTKSQVDALISDFGGFEVVTVLPTQDIKTNVIYLLGPIGSGADQYEEWIYSSNNWVKIGETSVDLSNYYTKSDVDTALAGKQDTIDASHKLPASNVSGLATVATTGDYDDLTDKPTIFSVSYDSTTESLVFTSN